MDLKLKVKLKLLLVTDSVSMPHGFHGGRGCHCVAVYVQTSMLSQAICHQCFVAIVVFHFEGHKYGCTVSFGGIVTNIHMVQY